MSRALSIFSTPSRPIRLLIVFVGIVLGQSVLYGPCLIGKKILLPLDILAMPNCFIPREPGSTAAQVHDLSLTDLVFLAEPARRFMVEEYHQGRIPLWTPDYLTGTPFVFPKFSPFTVIEASTASPVVWAWSQLAAALVAGLGMYLFCRRALGIGFWPAAICAWCYPLTGAMVVWLGYWIRANLSWLPWLLLAVDRVTRGTSRFAVVGLALVTAAVLVSGQLDIAGQMLLVSGIYGLWCVRNGSPRGWFAAVARKASLWLVIGWGLGFLLAAPHLLPLMEYARTGDRMGNRFAGTEERPPAGLSALPPMVLPDLYGRATRDSVPISPYLPRTQQESPSGAYAGVVATLLLCPLAFFSRRHRSLCLLLTGLALLGSAWWCNVPLIVNLLRLPGLNMMSHNRLVFLTAFTLLVMAGIGLDQLAEKRVVWKSWCWLLLLPITMLGGFCVFRSFVLPEPIATQMSEWIKSGGKVAWIADLDHARAVQGWYTRHFLVSALLCAAGVMAWLWVKWKPALTPRLVPFLGLVLWADLLWFAFGRPSQCDPSLYYPAVPALEQLTRSNPGRVLGYDCLVGNLSGMARLREVRGYDGVDPRRIIQLLKLTAHPNSPISEYAYAFMLVPRVTVTEPGHAQLPPVLDMLGVTHVVYRGTVPTNIHPVFASPDYHVLPNTNALPRAFVPRRVEVVNEEETRLFRMGEATFDPHQTAFVETPVTGLPDQAGGQAEVIAETPTRITLAVQMKTAGLVVLSDLWHPGWRAIRDDKPVEILQVNHALRGVVLPAGDSQLTFIYDPASFKWGLWLAGLGAIALVGIRWAPGARSGEASGRNSEGSEKHAKSEIGNPQVSEPVTRRNIREDCSESWRRARSDAPYLPHW